MVNKKTICILMVFFFFVSVLKVSANDSFDTAEEINVPDEFSGSVDEDNEVNYYMFQVNSSSIIEIEFTSDAESDQGLTLYNPNRESAFNLGSSGNSISSDSYVLSSETETDYWFIKVERSFGRSDGNYTFEVSLDSQDDSENGVDASSSFDDALEITEGNYQGMVKNMDQIDMYKIEVEPSSIIDIDFTSDAESDQNLHLYNPQRESVLELGSSEETYDNDNYVLSNETETDYWFIEVESTYGRSDGNYEFEVLFDSQNDSKSGMDVASTYKDAYEITEGNYQGMVKYLDQSDMYKIELQPNTTIEFDFTSDSESDQNLYLYNPERESVLNLASSEESISSENYQLEEDIETDFWFIEVESTYGRSDGNYEFKINLSGELDSDREKSQETDDSVDDSQEDVNGDDTQDNGFPWLFIGMGLIVLLVIFAFVLFSRDNE
ncbi:MAG: hypothetical protein ACOCP4_03545 [Candidatus Woesearchaeota archaeon]